MTIAQAGVAAADVGGRPSTDAGKRPLVPLALGAAGLAAGMVVAWRRASVGDAHNAVDVGLVVARGWAYMTAGLIAWVRRPRMTRIASLLLAVGFASFLLPLAVALGPASYGGGLRTGVSAASEMFFTVAIGLDFLYAAVLFHLVLGYPSGRLSSGLDLLVVIGFYLVVVGIGFARVATCEPGATWNGGMCLFAGALVIHPDASLSDALNTVYLYASFGLLLMLLAIITRRLLAPTGHGRRVLALVLLTAAAQVGLYLFLIVTSLWLALSQFDALALNHAQDWVEVAMPLAFLVALLHPRLARASLARLVVELRESLEPGRLRPVLARALRDPTVELGLWASETKGYVDSHGRPFELPPSGSGRAVSELKRGGEPLAALVHDPRLLEDPGLVEAVEAAAGLALENERLQAAIRAQLEEVRASRSRIVQAADAERKRVERDLHDGAQQRLLTLGLALRRAQRRLGTQVPEVEVILAEAAAELDAALGEVRQLARGIYPAILSDEGLMPALHSLADRSSVPARVTGSLDGRLPSSAETTAFFLVSEALVNVAKHAQATQVHIHAERSDEILTVEVADDGKGGADPARGSGLRGLADRIASVGGSMRIDSPPGGGTRIVAEVPGL